MGFVVVAADAVVAPTAAVRVVAGVEAPPLAWWRLRAVVGSDEVEGGDVVVVEVSASPGETRERRGFFVRNIVAGRAEDAVEGALSARACGVARASAVSVSL